MNFSYYYAHYIKYTVSICDDQELLLSYEDLNKEKILIEEINKKFSDVFDFEGVIYGDDYSKYVEFSNEVDELVAGFPKCLGNYEVNGKNVYLVEKYNCSDLCPNYGRVNIFVDDNISSSKCESIGGSFSFGPWGENWGCRIY